MIVILEGARGVGKTTFAKWLTFALNAYRSFDHRLPPAQYTKFSRGDNPHSGMKQQIEEMANDGILHVVDRFHITEFVMRLNELDYADTPKWLQLEADLHVIAQLLKRVDAKVYILTADTDVVFERVARRKDPGRRRDINKFVLAAFEYVSQCDNVPLIANNTWRDMIKGILRIVSDIRRTL